MSALTTERIMARKETTDHAHEAAIRMLQERIAEEYGDCDEDGCSSPIMDILEAYERERRWLSQPHQ